MKKIISIICIVALLVTSIGMTFTNVAAAPVTAQGSDTVYWPTFTDDEGNAWYPYGPSDAPIPENVNPEGDLTVVENNSGLPFTGLFNLASGCVESNYIQTDKVAASSVEAVLFYVEAPEDTAYSFKFYLYAYDSSMQVYTSKGRYSLANCKYKAEGSDTWSSIPSTTTYSVALSAGFKGYIYWPIKEATNNIGSGDGAITAEDYIAGLTVVNNGIPEGENVVVSAPMYVIGDFANPAAQPDEYVVVGGNKYYFDPMKNTVSGGTAPQNANVGTVLLDAPLGAAGITSARTFSIINDSITPLTDSASAELGQYYNTTALRNTGVKFNYTSTEGGSDTTTANPFKRKGIMLYVDLSACAATTTGLDIQVFLCNDTANANANAYPGDYNYPLKSTKNYYYLADGANSWTTATMGEDAGSNIILPNQFKGYVYIYDTMRTGIDNRNLLKYIDVKPLGTNNPTAKYYISAPIFVDSFDSTSTVVYYKNKAGLMDLATGEKYVEGYDEATTPFYGDETALYYDRDSVAQITPAALATDTFYHADFGLSSSDTNFSITSALNTSLVSSLSGAIKTPSLKFAPTAAVASGQVMLKMSESFSANKQLVYYIKNGATETSWKYSTIVPQGGSAVSASYISDSNFATRTKSTKLISVDGTVYDSVVKYVAGSSIAPEVVIPANFEGYMCIDLFKIYSFGTLTEVVPSQLYAFLSLDAGEEFYMSLPLVVEGNLDYFNVSGTAFINDTEVPQNVKGNFAIPYDHNGDLKVNILDLVKADLKDTADYALMRENYFDISVDSAAVASVFTER